GRGNSAVDGRGRRLVLQRAGVGGDTTGGDGTMAQRPEKLVVPLFAQLRNLDLGQGAGDTLIGLIDSLVDGDAVLGLEPIFGVPDIFRGRLHGEAGYDIMQTLNLGCLTHHILLESVLYGLDKRARHLFPAPENHYWLCVSANPSPRYGKDQLEMRLRFLTPGY